MRDAATRAEAQPIVAPPHNAWTIVNAERAGVIVDAKDYYVAFYEAALQARRYILMAGWQFDSTVELLRGDDVAVAGAAGGKVKLVEFLNELCATRPELDVYMLAWDFHAVLALEREWMQKLVFEGKTHKRVHFHFDDNHPDGGCHHQKFVVVDGALAFVGGMDVCESRWDDRRHLADSPERVSRKRRQKPYHDVQAYLFGRAAVSPLVELFEGRWKRAKGTKARPDLPDVPAVALPAAPPRGALPLPAGPVALSRTDLCNGEQIREIERLLVDAIDGAERLVYLETQYFSSREIREALVARMRRQGAPRPEIVLVLNRRAEALKEELAVGLRQAENLSCLRQVARETGTALGCYYTRPEGANAHLGESEDDDEATEVRTYIHTKLSIVDDRLLSVGSANLTNRSLGLDSELNATWDTALHEDPAPLRRAIRRIRVSLLAEHAGLAGPRALRAIVGAEGIVARLDALAAAPGARLRLHPSPTKGERDAMDVVDPQALPFDPEAPDGDERDAARREEQEILRADLRTLWTRVAG